MIKFPIQEDFARQVEAVQDNVLMIMSNYTSYEKMSKRLSKIMMT